MTALSLINFSKYDFDLSELYTRKFRKKLYQEKASYSNINFFKDIFEKIQNELAARRAPASTETELGGNKKKLKTLHHEVLREMDTFSNFARLAIQRKRRKNNFEVHGDRQPIC
jgi:hypothetical protein